MNPSWAVTPQKVQTVIERIIEVSKPRKLILFGSYVQGTMNNDSDLDVLVVTGDEIENPRKESVRIRRALKGIGISLDILVISESMMDVLKDTPGLIYREILKKGEIVYESSR
ncbi:MAG: nucleotidyltransferase domain-containing protein [Candidatus Latescibacter sp.]|nr:nucleotidyltransferase domain-containing protein [Candidatus Latescibacter sp.]